MNDQSKISKPENLDLFGECISSLEPVSGRLPVALPVGLTTRSSGPAHVPVSRFRSLDSEVAMSTNDTSGPLFTASSPSAVLQRSLESKLRARMDVNGSPECALTWRALDMPAGPPICQLVQSARRRSATDSGGSQWMTPRVGETTDQTSGVGYFNSLSNQMSAQWPTPLEGDWQVHLTPEKWDERTRRKAAQGINLHQPLPILMMKAQWPTPEAGAFGTTDVPRLLDRRTRMKAKHGNGNGFGLTLGQMVTIEAAQWPTPNAMCAHDSQTHRSGARSDELLLTGLMNKTAQWPAPTVADVTGGRKTRSGARSDEMLLNGLMSQWATPRLQSCGNPVRASDGRARLEDQVFGATPTGSTAQTEKRGAPNPVFACWLMGWPDELISGALRAIQSFRNSRRSSSRRSSKADDECEGMCGV
jgi:hypothetical protein